MIRPVILYPHPFLRQVSKAYEPGELTSPEFAELVRDLRETVVAANGAAISAVQVGVGKRVIVIHPELAHKHPDVLVNPVITARVPVSEPKTEGCLSMPGIRVLVQRPVGVSVEAIGMYGAEVKFDCADDLAQALEHECEHLDGVLLVDHAKPVKKEMINRRMANKKGNAVVYGQR